MRSVDEGLFSSQLFGGDTPDVGFFTWDIPENILYADGALADLFGIDPREAERGLPIETYLDRVHPDDRSQLAEAISDSIIAHMNQQETYRVLDATGRYVTVASFGRGFRDRDGLPRRYVGIVVPVNEVEAVSGRMS
ncbi:PAS domain-containing protein [Neorhizobium huautlense]|uniref:PAS domain-containing protein n=1 Tax=Neorhizobium huautlense TaxID=67774 RepID=A0ABT9Q0U4_9HYPH|nr:PAS domain-containing protein [Neorhizobium huautlense]MDP9840095.1 PAS domain-containing protein [Neorhizobium huautlense]